MSREADKCVKSASRSQRPPWAQQQRKRKEPTPGDARGPLDPGETPSVQEEVKTAGLQGKRPGKASESRRSPGPQRKLSDASNASEDLSKDSGCLSGKLSSSDSSSEISDCPSEGNKPDSPGGELSWTEGRVYESPGAERGAQGEVCAEAGRGASPPAGGPLSAPSSSEALLDLMMGDATEDLVREMEDLRSENEYLKDEVEELRCEMLEMRDMFQEEEVYQLQELRLQLEQANKTCRILQYRLRKAERRSIRVAQTGQVDGELVRTLEHDIKVAKSVSLRLYNELEAVQKKNSQLEWDNEVLREKTQELEVAKQVLQAEVEKARESSVKKKSIRSTASKAEKRLSQQIEDDSGDLRCQLHFAKEELALMCKKLSKLVLESEGMQEQLAKYHSAYGDIDAVQSGEGKQNSTHAREAEVKVHLKLVEEEAMLLSRRIVELEVENRGLRAEMSDLRERGGGGGAEEEAQENPDATDQNAQSDVKTTGRKERLKARDQNETSCHVAREGPVGGEREPAESREGDGKRIPESGLRGMTLGDFRTLLALRDHSCILSSAIQLLKAQPTNGHHSSPSTFIIPTDAKSKSQTCSFPGPLNEALELLQAMLVAFIGRVEKLLTGKLSLPGEGQACDHAASSSLPGATWARHDNKESEYKQECVEDLRTTEVKQRARQSTQGAVLPWDLVRGHRDPKMHLCLQILWILHRWCRVKCATQEGKEARDKSVLELQSLLQQVGAELQDEPTESEAGAAQDKAAQPDVSRILPAERWPGADRMRGSAGKRRRQFPICGFERKSWCYLSQEAAQLDQEDPLKTWDHLIMPRSFPGLDVERISAHRSHTAPERSALRIYYSPPSARRVQLAQPVRSPNGDGESEDTPSPWCTPPTSLSPLCQGSTANLSDDMKEATSSRRTTGSRESGARFLGRWVDVATLGTQTHIKPQMVSVGLQTDGIQSSVRTSPSRLLNPSLASSRAHPISASLDRLASRTERSRTNTSSPKLYRSRSATNASSVPSTSSTSVPRDRSLWNLSHQNQTGLSWTRHPSHRPAAAPPQSPGSPNSEPPSRGAKPPNKSPGGLVTEFLRRVSGRAEKPAPGQKTRGVPKSLERVPSRPPAAPLQRSDSVTRIVNQRFMKQREESARGLREEKGGSLGSRHSGVTSEEGNYDCSSGGTLTFCFARPSRSTSDARLQRARLHGPAVGEGGAAGREFRM